MPTPLTVTVRTCPACGSDDVRHYPASRRTGHVRMRCRGCGLATLATRSFAPPETVATGAGAEDYIDGYVELKREEASEAAWAEALGRLESMVPATRRRLFDVGAGDGSFLAEARERGWQPAGNEVMETAVHRAAERGIDLHLGDLSAIDAAEGTYDVATMWCVLAHVPDPERLLRDTVRLLRPGGVLFMQTPRVSAIDRVGLLANRASGGRSTRLVDRRIAEHHWQVHTERSIRTLLGRHGFDVLTVEPKARYSLRSWSYLHSLGLPESTSRRVGPAVDALLDRGLSPRIVSDVYARLP